jgi:hypothetical protein
MAYGVKPLRKIQMGIESTAGTAVAASFVWRGPANLIQDTRKVVKAEEQIGILAPSFRPYTPEYGAALAFPAQPATWEHLLHIFEAGIDTTTPSADGAAAKVWEYTVGASANAVKTYTIEGGDNVDAGEMEYSFVTQYTLSGKAREAVMMSAQWVGRQYTDTTFTGALSAATVTEMLASKATLYIDSVAAGLGANARAGILQAWELTVNTGWAPVWVGNGQLYFQTIKNVGPSAQLKLVLEHEDYVPTERAAYQAMTPRAVRIKIVGPTLNGSTYTVYTHLLDFVGVYSAFGELDDDNGDNLVTATLDANYNSTITSFVKHTHVNATASL